MAQRNPEQNDPTAAELFGVGTAALVLKLVRQTEHAIVLIVHGRRRFAVRKVLQERGEQLRAAAEPLERHSMDDADSASDEFDHNLALSELSAEQDALFEIEAALKRIANGSYGTCEETARRIPPERLEAIPWTRFVTEVAARLERRNLVKGPHLAAPGSLRGPETEGVEENEAEDGQPPV